MDRRIFLSALTLALAPAGMVQAATFEDSVVAQLRAQGYGQIEVERTLLGRVRILALLGNDRREIILNPRTGEVLRDVFLGSDGEVMPQIARASGKSQVSKSGDSGSTGSGIDDGGGSGGSDDSGGSDGGDSGSDGGGSSAGNDDSGGSGSGGGDSGSDGGSGGGDGDHEDEDHGGHGDDSDHE